MVIINEKLPDNYQNKFIEISEHYHMESFNCSFGLKLQSEEEESKWVADYNKKNKETMVYERIKTQMENGS